MWHDTNTLKRERDISLLKTWEYNPITQYLQERGMNMIFFKKKYEHDTEHDIL